KDAFAAATGEAARQNIKDSWPRSDCQGQCGSKEKQETVCVEHLENCMGQGPRKQGGLPIENCRLKTALSLVWLHFRMPPQALPRITPLRIRRKGGACRRLRRRARARCRRGR